jgi:hypothetical protein
VAWHNVASATAPSQALATIPPNLVNVNGSSPPCGKGRPPFPKPVARAAARYRICLRCALRAQKKKVPPALWSVGDLFDSFAIFFYLLRIDSRFFTPSVKFFKILTFIIWLYCNIVLSLYCNFKYIYYEKVSNLFVRQRAVISRYRFRG